MCLWTHAGTILDDAVGSWSTSLTPIVRKEGYLEKGKDVDTSRVGCAEAPLIGPRATKMKNSRVYSSHEHKQNPTHEESVKRASDLTGRGERGALRDPAVKCNTGAKRGTPPREQAQAESAASLGKIIIAKRSQGPQLLAKVIRTDTTLDQSQIGFEE